MEGMHSENLKKGWEARGGNSISVGWELQARIGVKTAVLVQMSMINSLCVTEGKKGRTSRWHLKSTSNGKVLKEDRKVSLIHLWEGVCVDPCVENIWWK